MATIKSCTSAKQSCKLAEILPLESADMYYDRYGDPYFINISVTHERIKNDRYQHLIPCWSLAALLDTIPKDKSIECSLSFGYYSGEGEYIEKWLCVFEKEGETTNDYIIETIDGDNPIDACVAMIEKLHELKML